MTDSLSTPLQPFRLADSALRYGTSGSGVGGAFAISGAFPLTGSVQISGLIGYHSMPTSISAEQRNPGATATHNLSLFSSMLQIAPQAEIYGLFGGVSLHPIIGLDIGIPLSTTESDRKSVV